MRVASVTDRLLDLPPPYELVTLRESRDAFAHAVAVAADAGAGTLTWVRRFDVAEFALVLEPEEPLSTARRAFWACMTALGDALAGCAPPERPITFDWADAIRVDGVLIGGGRLAWPETAEDEPPPWLVFGAIVRTAVIRADDPGLRPLLGGLDELGFEGLDPGLLIESFARHLMLTVDLWNERGFPAVARRVLERLPRTGAAVMTLDQNGDLLVRNGDGPVERRALQPALAEPTWLNPATGLPWL